MKKKKEKEIDLSEIKKIFEDMNDSKGKLGLSLLQKAEFMNETLKELQQRVVEDGVVVSMCQGSYEIERENPALRSYNTTIKNYTSVIKQINDLLPQEEKVKDGEKLLEFLAGN